MKQRLERSGLRSISAVVDITNYVMLELGQPLHAYDDRLLDGAVVVRFAREGEKLTLLNGQVLDLASDLLMVADEKKPLGLAGIMGGEHSGIADDTTRVYLEGAFWSPAVIQGKMRRLGFTSDAGYRFERGVDFDGCARAVERATQLILAICGGRAGPLTDAVAAGDLPRRDPVRVRSARIARLLGHRDSRGRDRRCVHAPGLSVRARRRRLRRHAAVAPLRPRDRGGLRRGGRAHPRLRPHSGDAERARAAHAARPGRPSIAPRRQAHAGEPRLAGGRHVRLRVVRDGSRARSVRQIRSRCAIRSPRSSTSCARRCCPASSRRCKTNVNRKASRVRVFELGRTFRRAAAGYDQPVRLGGLAYGPADPEQWGAADPRRRLLRREGRSRDAGRAASTRDPALRRIRRCIPDARPTS